MIEPAGYGAAVLPLEYAVTDDMLLLALGVAFADAGIYRDAIRMWRKVVELAPDSPEAVSAKPTLRTGAMRAIHVIAAGL